MTEMVTVNGVRYRIEDAPERVAEKAAPAPQNKARDARTKGGPRGDSAPAAERG